MEMMQMDVVMDNIWFDYGDRKVLKAFQFSTSKEIIGIVGPNGCGKTTLLRLLARILVPKEGAILVDGRDLQSLSPKEIGKRISLLPQNSSITFEFTAFDVVLMGRNPHLDRFETASKHEFGIAEEAMKLTRTWDLRDRFVTELSGGEKQKVLIARAIAQEPRILLLDEPTAHLDIGAQLEILELIKALNKEKSITIIAVFHDLNIAARYCSRLLLIHEGKIMSAGVPEEVLTPENIKRVYTVDAKVGRNMETDSIQVVPLSTLPSGGI